MKMCFLLQYTATPEVAGGSAYSCSSLSGIASIWNIPKHVAQGEDRSGRLYTDKQMLSTKVTHVTSLPKSLANDSNKDILSSTRWEITNPSHTQKKRK